MAISAQVPAATATEDTVPVKMRSSCRRRVGVSRVAAVVSAAMTAYPSIADRANAGTSMDEETSTAAMRPAAASSVTRSVRPIGRTADASRRRASSNEMVEVNGLISCRSA